MSDSVEMVGVNLFDLISARVGIRGTPQTYLWASNHPETFGTWLTRSTITNSSQQDMKMM